MKTDDFMGRWVSDGYESIIEVHNIDEKGLITGIYSSKTGVTAEYYLTGYTDSKPEIEPSSDTDTITVSFSVSWRPNSSEIELDESFHWVSAFGGQLLKDKDGTNIMTLTYLLIKQKPASDNYDSIVTFTEVFRRDE